MDSQVRALPFDASKLDGLSRRLLESHHTNNYTGAVKRLNAIRAQLRQFNFASSPGFELNGLKREELVAANSMVLHEVYFDSLGSDGHVRTPAMDLALTANFGSATRWQEEFTALGKALAGGSGWVVLTFQPRDGTLINQWAADHTNVLAGGVPILALDMYEHSYHMDYGAAAGAYVDAFMTNIDWTRVYGRYQAAVDSASESLAATLDDARKALVLDVRRAGVYAEAKEMVATAEWRDPALVDEWGPALAKGQDLVVYCVYGHEVGRATALRLRSAGVNARFMRGGFDAWKAAALPVQAKASRDAQ